VSKAIHGFFSLFPTTFPFRPHQAIPFALDYYSVSLCIFLLGGNQQSAEEPGKTGDQQFSG